MLILVGASIAWGDVDVLYRSGDAYYGHKVSAVAFMLCDNTTKMSINAPPDKIQHDSTTDCDRVAMVEQQKLQNLAATIVKQGNSSVVSGTVKSVSQNTIAVQTSGGMVNLKIDNNSDVKKLIYLSPSNVGYDWTVWARPKVASGGKLTAASLAAAASQTKRPTQAIPIVFALPKNDMTARSISTTGVPVHPFMVYQAFGNGAEAYDLNDTAKAKFSDNLKVTTLKQSSLASVLVGSHIALTAMKGPDNKLFADTLIVGGLSK